MGNRPVRYPTRGMHGFFRRRRREWPQRKADLNHFGGSIMFDWLRRKASWKPPQVSGEERDLRTFGTSDRPVSRTARWNGSELIVETGDAGCVSLFDLPLPDLEQCRITYRFRIQTEALKASVYPEMWCRIPEKGLFFSRGMDRKIQGTVDWAEVEISFYLEKGQRADLLHLNLAFEGAGGVRLKDIRVTTAAVSA